MADYSSCTDTTESTLITQTTNSNVSNSTDTTKSCKNCPTETCETGILITPESCDTSSDTYSETCDYSYDDTTGYKGKKLFIFDVKVEEGKRVIYVNDKRKPILRIKRGYKYLFQLNNLNSDLVLTMNPVGMWNGKPPKPLNGTKIANNGTFEMKADESVPKYFYYHLVNAQFAGGIAIVN